MFVDQAPHPSIAEVLAGFDNLVALALAPGKPRRAFALEGDLSHTYQSDGDGDLAGEEPRFFWASRWSRLAADGLPVNESTVASCLLHERECLLERFGVAADASPSDVGDLPVPQLRVDDALKPMDYFRGRGASRLWLAEAPDAIVAIQVLTDDLPENAIVSELSDPDILVHHWRKRVEVALRS